MASDRTEIPLTVDPELRSVLRIGAVSARPVRVGRSEERLREEIRQQTDDLVSRYAGAAPAEIPGLSHARRLYRAFGIDPTRIRPSSEALLRRLQRGKPFPWILDAVDVGNLCSLLFLLPIGLYDADRLRGAVVLRRGRSGESYAGIRKDTVHLAGRPVLADEAGPFGNPTSDSLRTSVTEATEALWMVIFAPLALPAETLAEHVGTAQRWFARHLAPPDRSVATSARLIP